MEAKSGEGGAAGALVDVVGEVKFREKWVCGKVGVEINSGEL